MKTHFYLFLLSTLFFTESRAQKIFSEGIIKYNVFVNGNKTAEGVYLITVKNGFTKRELAMNNGYNNIVIHNHKTGTSVSLNIDQENKYALQMSAAEVQESNKRFEHASFNAQDLKKKLANYSCTSSKVLYTNGESAIFFYTTDLLPPNDSFNTMFPGLAGIPLEYQVKSNESTTIHFVATEVETKSIDLNLFEIPKDYKIVTRQELEKIK